MYSLKMKDLIRDSFKGITPNYVDHSNVIVLNQKCIRNNQIDFSLARFHDSKKTYPSKKELQVGDILINSTGAGTAGRCAFIRELPKNYSVVADSHILVVRISDFFIAGCVQYSLFNIEKLLQTFLDGSTGQGEFDKQRLLNVIIPIPNNPKYIYQFLSNLDKKIALNKQINARLEEMAKTLYDYWFVQFDFPDANGKPYKSSGGEMVFDETLKREIPKGWVMKSLGEVISLERGVTYSKDSICNDENGTGVLRATNISGNNIDLNDLIYISDEVGTQQKLKPFDILIVMSSGSKEHIGKNGVYYFEQDNAFGAFCSKITPQKVFFEFVSIFLQSNNFRNYVKNQCLGTNINNLNNSHILHCPIVRPNDEYIEAFHKQIKLIYEKISCNVKQNHQLTQLRDFLLSMLMNGQVSVAE